MCSHEFEELLKHSEKTPNCPECNGYTERLISQCGLMTDSVFMSGLPTLDEQIGPVAMPAFEAYCKRTGFRPSERAQYCPGIARKPFDPEAFITTRAEGAAVAARRHLSVEGAVKTVRRGGREGKKPVRLAQNLVQDYERAYIQENPDLAHGDRKELREKIINRHGAKE
jgi:hypothetical protein